MQLTLKRQATNQVQQQSAATASDENDHTRPALACCSAATTFSDRLAPPW
jgi:hypothetical protein